MALKYETDICYIFKTSQGNKVSDRILKLIHNSKGKNIYKAFNEILEIKERRLLYEAMFNILLRN